MAVAPPPPPRLSQAAEGGSKTELSDLTEDLLEEIFLRLSPEERRKSWHHIRASFVCRSWRRIISGDDSYFFPRYFARHRDAIFAQQDAQREAKLRQEWELEHRFRLRERELSRHVHIS